ncbi:MAG: CpaF family protein [Halobacteriovoraceae bacterium]|jgi:pilus assembly protein CpaF|nr:CpaF family protein [Halobacteriovoraceae bacterium]MBT5095157.1 CpaF family protein [Halobacteriovoraceae bacterium]
MEQQKENSVWALINDLGTKKGITEIVINNPKTVFVERAGQFIQLNVSLTKADIQKFSIELATFNKKRFDIENPILDGNLPDGSRVNIINEPFSNGCPAITIRKYLKDIKKFETSPGIFGLTDKWVEFFLAAVSARLNIIVSGGTGVGKTTFMNLLLGELSPAERVITIEDTLELTINMPNSVRLEARGGSSSLDKEKSLNIRDLVKNTLRMRPDRIIVGEIRGGELFDLLQAMNTGHDGSMASIHASSPAECLSRMETLYLLSGFDVPFHVVRRQIASAVDLIIQVGRNREGKRVITHVGELTGVEGNTILMQQLAELEGDVLKGAGISSKNMDKLHHNGGLPKDFFVDL